MNRNSERMLSLPFSAAELLALREVLLSYICIMQSIPLSALTQGRIACLQRVSQQLAAYLAREEDTRCTLRVEEITALLEAMAGFVYGVVQLFPANQEREQVIAQVHVWRLRLMEVVTGVSYGDVRSTGASGDGVGGPVFLAWYCSHEHEKHKALLYPGMAIEGVQVDILALNDEEGWSYFLVRRLATQVQGVSCFVSSTGERYAWFEEVERQVDVVYDLAHAYAWLYEMKKYPERFA